MPTNYYELTTDEYLDEGEYLESKSGRYKAIMQQDGNFCVYKDGVFLFGTANKAGYSTSSDENSSWRAIMQGDGNFCVYKITVNTSQQFPYFTIDKNYHFGTSQDAGYATATGEYKLVMQDDGNLCVYTAAGKFRFGTVQSANYTPEILPKLAASL